MNFFITHSALSYGQILITTHTHTLISKTGKTQKQKDGDGSRKKNKLQNKIKWHPTQKKNRYQPHAHTLVWRQPARLIQKVQQHCARSSV